MIKKRRGFAVTHKGGTVDVYRINSKTTKAYRNIVGTTQNGDLPFSGDTFQPREKKVF